MQDQATHDQNPMPEALTRPDPAKTNPRAKTAHRRGRGFDAGRAGAEAASVRGPFRPDVWLNARRRQSIRLAPRFFRLADVLTATSITLLFVRAPSGSLTAASLAQLLPYGIGLAVTLVLLRLGGLYQFARGQRGALHIVCVAAAVLIAMAAAVWTSLVLDLTAIEAGVVSNWAGVMIVSLCGLHVVWSMIVRNWRRSGAMTPNIVLVGATRHAERLIVKAMERRDFNVLGVFDDRTARSPDTVAGVPVLGRPADLLVHPMTPYVDRIVLAIDPKAQARVRELSALLTVLPNDVVLLMDTDAPEDLSHALDRLAHTGPTVFSSPSDPDRKAFAKRVQDLIVGSIALIALAPVMGLIALAIRLDGPGPVFSRQRRHGFHQEEIIVWKFRTMRPETADATASRQVTADDDRVTRVGRVLRSTSLDELPQLLNVLAGEMSLVGPRPHAIGMKTGETESALLVAEYAHRHRIKPGMTGWAAIKGSRGPMHAAEDVRRRVALDIDYIERQSTWLDLWIMAVTVPVMLGDRGSIR